MRAVGVGAQSNGSSGDTERRRRRRRLTSRLAVGTWEMASPVTTRMSPAASTKGEPSAAGPEKARTATAASIIVVRRSPLFDAPPVFGAGGLRAPRTDRPAAVARAPAGDVGVEPSSWLRLEPPVGAMSPELTAARTDREPALPRAVVPPGVSSPVSRAAALRTRGGATATRAEVVRIIEPVSSPLSMIVRSSGSGSPAMVMASRSDPGRTRSSTSSTSRCSSMTTS